MRKNPLLIPLACLLASAITAALVLLPNYKPDRSAPPRLHDALKETSRMADLAAIHKDVAGNREGSCSLCHMLSRVKGRVALWSNSSSWIASAKPAAATSESLRSSEICLSCHDGSASNFTRDHSLGGMRSGLSSPHPIDVDYAKARSRHPGEYNDIRNNPDIGLDHGRVTCVSCHKAHSAGESGGPDCTACHIR